ncbi:MAG TPA: hypothetical protein PLD10_07210 [Rhodopila sp.]|nr:hypothetical protein [Rhodopila sp.]
MTNIIAKLGQSQVFVTAMAHAWFAYAVIATSAHFGLSLWIAAPAAVAIAAGKEYWFDLRYETKPPQTVIESTQDFIEYLAGIALAVIVFH